MTAAQFEALADLLRLRAGPAQVAAHLVLVGGLTVAEASRQAGLSAQAASNAVQRARAGLRLVRIAAGQEAPAEA
ncbi:MAG: transcriptional regulator KorA [Proteobacteria bacterium]|nr:transcriptional regulator KorA [Pseudomonadota bacterium]